MKTIITLLTTTMLVAGATNAMARQQGSDEAAGYALSQQSSNGAGPFASARMSGEAGHNDFQLGGR